MAVNREAWEKRRLPDALDRRPREDTLADLRSNESIAMNLEALKKRDAARGNPS